MSRIGLFKTGLKEEGLSNIPTVVIIIAALFLLVYVVPTYLMSFEEKKVFILKFGFIPTLFVMDHGFITRMSTITYSFLHGSWTHLGLNMAWFVVFGSPLANRLGTFSFLLFWIFAAIIAALTHLLFYPHSEVVLIGASGAISGLMGAAARYDFYQVSDLPSHDNRPKFIRPIYASLHSPTVLIFINSWLFLNIVIGVTSIFFGEKEATIAWEAHIGGLFAGFFAISPFNRLSSWRN
ncbi:MAG: Rhomboid protease [Candidatus Tokpelaia sp. JSC188]|nr:MAG: Rhomboid protease [Candidatus Tokpelaia sp. JSC188]